MPLLLLLLGYYYHAQAYYAVAYKVPQFLGPRAAERNKVKMDHNESMDETEINGSR